uniref:Uncharacterized protein n=1 Tax=Rhizophora mucronata TaxID=61149 RepID=A0A2P2QK67_RHIMU
MVSSSVLFFSFLGNVHQILCYFLISFTYGLVMISVQAT